MRHLFDRKGIIAGLEILSAELEFEEKLKALFRKVLRELPIIFLFDDFEQNLIRRGDEYWLTPEAREVMIPLLTALEWSEGQTNLIITSRYPFVLEVVGRNLPEETLLDMPLMSLREADLKKKQAELPHIAVSKQASLYLEVGGGNPRLLEWLDKIAGDEEKYDLPSLQAQLRGKQEEFVLQYLADVLAKTEGEAFHNFLRRAAVFRQPVPQEAFIPLLGGGGVGSLLETGVNLTLFEREDRRGGSPVFWVTPVIRDSQWAQVPSEEQSPLHRHAYQWYDAKIEEVENPDPTNLEEAMHHALAADNIRGVCKHAIDLGNYLREMLLYREELQMQQHVADRIDEAVIAEALEEEDGNVALLLNNLGFTLDDLGEHHKAISYYEQALAIFTKVYGPGHSSTLTVQENLDWLRQKSRKS